jgi:hypothetical protein
MAGVEVRLAGLTFNDGPDGDGDEFIVSDLDGWDGPGVELVVVERPVSDGAVVAFGRRTARALVLSGWVVAAEGHMGRARRKLETAMYSLVGTGGTLEVDEDADTYALTVRLSAALKTKQVGPTAITFQAPLVATDPDKADVGS